MEKVSDPWEPLGSGWPNSTCVSQATHKADEGRGLLGQSQPSRGSLILISTLPSASGRGGT